MNSQQRWQKRPLAFPSPPDPMIIEITIDNSRAKDPSRIHAARTNVPSAENTLKQI